MCFNSCIGGTSETSDSEEDSNNPDDPYAPKPKVASRKRPASERLVDLLSEANEREEKRYQMQLQTAALQAQATQVLLELVKILKK